MEGAGRMLPQRLAADRPRAASQAERERDQNSRHRLDEAARRQEHEQRSQRGQQEGGEGGAVPPPETVVFDIDEQVKHGVSMSIENCSLSGRTLGRHHVEPPSPRCRR